MLIPIYFISETLMLKKKYFYNKERLSFSYIFSYLQSQNIKPCFVLERKKNKSNLYLSIKNWPIGILRQFWLANHIVCLLKQGIRLAVVVYTTSRSLLLTVWEKEKYICLSDEKVWFHIFLKTFWKRIFFYLNDGFLCICISSISSLFSFKIFLECSETF